MARPRKNAAAQKGAKAKVQGRIHRRADQIDLPVSIDEKELGRRKNMLLASLEDQETLRAQRKAELADLNVRAKAIEESIHEHRMAMQNGTVDKPVKVEHVYDYEAETYELVRLDTNEVVETRQLSEEERQMEFDA